MEDKIWYLSQVNVLKDLSKDQLMTLGSQCGMQNFKRGDNLYLPGQTNDIYFLKKGSVKLITHSKEGDELIQDIINVGEVFGKFDPDQPPGALTSAEAMDDVIVCYLPISKWQDFVGNNISLNLKVVKWMGLRIRKIERKVDLLYFKDAKTRLIELFRDLANRIGKNSEDGIQIPIKLTHEEIGQLTGNSRQSVTTIMNAMRNDGLLQYDRNRITVKQSLLSLPS